MSFVGGYFCFWRTLALAYACTEAYIEACYIIYVHNVPYASALYHKRAIANLHCYH